VTIGWNSSVLISRVLKSKGCHDDIGFDSCRNDVDGGSCRGVRDRGGDFRWACNIKSNR
jgi:hypothetical protein